jgi:flavin-binding protein dodecin
MAHISQGAVKIVELVGVSEESWSDAARNAVAEASKSIRGIVGVDVVRSSAVVDDGKITEYHANVKIAFPVERG